MTDDKLQGILFSKTDSIDLVQRTARERLIQQMLDKKHALQSWSVKQQSQLKQTMSLHKSEYAVRGNRHYSQDVTDLHDRLNLPG